MNIRAIFSNIRSQKVLAESFPLANDLLIENKKHKNGSSILLDIENENIFVRMGFRITFYYNNIFYNLVVQSCTRLSCSKVPRNIE